MSRLFLQPRYTAFAILFDRKVYSVNFLLKRQNMEKMNELVKSLSRNSRLEFWQIISKESYLFFESLYKKHVDEYNNFAGNDNEKIKLYNETSNLRIMLLIHFCMICESIINNFGTIKLGEKFYSENIEKINPISKKIALLKSIVSNLEIDEKQPIIKRIQKFYNARNDFIHPKYKCSLKENYWEPKIINLNYKFELVDSEKLKKTITELLFFLYDNEHSSFFYKERYNWSNID